MVFAVSELINEMSYQIKRDINIYRTDLIKKDVWTVMNDLLSNDFIIYSIAVLSGIFIHIKLPFGILRKPFTVVSNSICSSILLSGLAYVGIKTIPHTYKFMLPIGLVGMSVIAKYF